jgi:hypothetical protein
MNKLNLKTFKYLITIMKYPKCLQSSGEASEDAIAQYIGPEVIENVTSKAEDLGSSLFSCTSW